MIWEEEGARVKSLRNDIHIVGYVHHIHTMWSPQRVRSGRAPVSWLYYCPGCAFGPSELAACPTRCPDPFRRGGCAAPISSATDTPSARHAGDSQTSRMSGTRTNLMCRPAFRER